MLSLIVSVCLKSRFTAYRVHVVTDRRPQVMLRSFPLFAFPSSGKEDEHGRCNAMHSRDKPETPAYFNYRD